VVGLVWAASKVFRTLDTAFSEIYGNDTPPGLAAQFKNGAVVFGAMTTAVVAIVAGGSVVALVPSLSAVTVSFLPMYLVFPDVPVSIREGLLGAATNVVLSGRKLSAGVPRSPDDSADEPDR